MKKDLAICLVSLVALAATNTMPLLQESTVLAGSRDFSPDDVKQSEGVDQEPSDILSRGVDVEPSDGVDTDPSDIRLPEGIDLQPTDFTLQGVDSDLTDILSRGIDLVPSDKKAPIAISGDNVYVVWWSNKTGSDEVNFRASADAGTTFADKINLSNTINADSVDAQVATEGDNVFISWWEPNATANEPVLRISTDNGETFGPLLKLATNGTIGIS